MVPWPRGAKPSPLARVGPYGCRRARGCLHPLITSLPSLGVIVGSAKALWALGQETTVCVGGGGGRSRDDLLGALVTSPGP